MNHNFSRRNLNTTRQLSGKLIYCKTQDTDLGWPSALIPALLLKHWCSFLITASAFDHSALKGTCFHWPPRSPFIIIFFYELHCCSSNVKPWTFRDLAHKWWSNIDNQLKPLRFHDQLELLLAIYSQRLCSSRIMMTLTHQRYTTSDNVHRILTSLFLGLMTTSAAQ